MSWSLILCLLVSAALFVLLCWLGKDDRFAETVGTAAIFAFFWPLLLLIWIGFALRDLVAPFGRPNQ